MVQPTPVGSTVTHTARCRQCSNLLGNTKIRIAYALASCKAWGLNLCTSGCLWHAKIPSVCYFVSVVIESGASEGSLPHMVVGTGLAVGYSTARRNGKERKVTGNGGR